MKKRKNGELSSNEKKHKNSEENTTKVDNILEFCTTLNTRFSIIEKEKITEEDLKNFINILKITPIIEEIDSGKLYILHYLAQLKKPHEYTVEFAEYFIKNGGDVNQKNNGGHSALVYASINGNYNFFELLIDNEANVNSQNIRGNSILHNIIKQPNNLNIYIKKLLQSGANIELPNDKGETPLEFAFKHHNPYALLTLIDHGAKITNYIKNDIFKVNPIDDNHKLCQNLSYLATLSWSLISLEENELVKVTKITGERYCNLAEKNADFIKQIAHNIIVTSPEEFMIERLKTFQEECKKIDLNPTVASSSLLVTDEVIPFAGANISSFEDF